MNFLRILYYLLIKYINIIIIVYHSYLKYLLYDKFNLTTREPLIILFFPLCYFPLTSRKKIFNKIKKNMRIFKSHPLLKLVNSYIIDSPQPSNLSYLWNFGSLLAFCLAIQIVTGITLAMHYNPSVLEAFNSVEHIMRDVNNGWLIRYLHSNTASAFFFIVYLHIGKRIILWIIQSTKNISMNY